MEENEIYIVDGQKYEVNPKRKNDFFKKYPNAVLFEEPVKINPNAQGAAAGGEQAPNTDSNLGNGSLVFEPPKYEQQFKTYLDGKEKNKEQRLEFLNSGLDAYEPKISSEDALSYANILTNKIDFKNLKEEEDISASLNTSLSSLIKGDEYIQKHLLPDLQEIIQPKIDTFKKLLEGKYDLTDINEVQEANKKLEYYATQLYGKTIRNNRTYNNRINTYKEAVLESYNNKFKDLSDEQRQKLVEAKRKELGIADDTMLTEGVKKGLRNISIGIQKTDLSFKNTNILKLQKSIEGLNDNDFVTEESGAQPGLQGAQYAKRTKVSDIKLQIAQQKISLINNFVDLRGDEAELAFFRKGETEGLLPKSFGDLAFLVGEQIPQLPLAVVTFGAGVFAQEYGNAYFDTIMAKMEANGEEYTEERFLEYLDSGEGDAAIAAVSATIQSALEFAGAATIVGTLITKPGKAILRTLMKDGVKKFIRAGGLQRGGKNVARGYLTEYLTESFQTLTSQISKGYSINDIDKYIDFDEIQKSGAAGGLVGFFLPFGKQVATQTIRETKAVTNNIIAKFDPNSQAAILNNLKKEITAAVLSKKITEQEGEAKINAISDIENSNATIPKIVKGEKRIEAIELLIEKRKLENENQNIDKVFKPEEQIQEINQKLGKIFIESKISNELQNQIVKGKLFANELERKLETIEINSKEEFVKKGKELGESWDLTDGGRITTDKKTGESKIYINKVAAAETRNVTVMGHEVYHHGLFSILRTEENKTVVVELSNLLKEHIKTLDPETFGEDSFLGQVMKKYENDPNYTEQMTAEELFTSISDLYNNPFLKLDEGFLTRIGDFIRRLLQDLGFKKIKFDPENKGKDIFNFIKDYSYSVRKGKTSGAIIKALNKGVAISPEIESKAQAIDDVVSQASKSVELSEKATELYSQKGIEAAGEIIELFDKPLNNIVQKYRSVPKYNFQDLKDAISFDPDRGLLGLIMKYNPDSNVPIAAYINKYLAQRSKEFAQKLLGTEFESDVTEARGVTDTTTEEVTETQETKPKKDLAEQLNITEKLKQEVLQATEATFGTRLPQITSKEFAKELTKNFRIKLQPKILKLAGKGVAYETFLRDNFETIYKILPQSTINKRFKPFKEPVIDKKTGKQLRERTAEGNKVFIKKKISKAEWVSYFLGTEVKRSTQGTRKTSIVEEVGVELAFDAVNEIVKDPSIMNKFKDIQELQGNTLAENYIAEITKQIDRNPNSKASKGLSPSEFSVHAIALGKEVQTLNENFVKNPISEEDLKIQLKNIYKKYKFPKEYNEEQKNFIKSFIKDLNEKNLIKGTASGGIIFEQAVINQLKEFGLPVLEDTGAGYDNNSSDIQIKYGDGILYVEAKESATARMGGGSAKFDFSKPKGQQITLISGKETVSKEKLPNGELINAFLEKFLPQIEQTLDFINKKEGTNYKQFPYSPAKISKETFEELKKQNFYQEYARSGGVRITPKSIEKHYNNKNNFYIHIGKKGTYFLGKNILNIENVTRFDSDLNVEFRMGRSGNGYFGFRIEMKIAEPNKMPKSKFNIETKEGAAALNQKLTSKASKGLSRQFNELLQATSGIPWYEKFSPAKSQLVGQSKGRFKFFIPYSAEDFMGLLYATLGEGKLGNQQKQWYEDNLIRPFSRGIQAWQREKENSLREWAALKKEASKDVPLNLTKKNSTGFTNQDSVRLYIWSKQGMPIEGILKKEINENIKIVRNDPLLKAFAERLMVLNPEGYPAPTSNWTSGDITTDLVAYVNDVRRTEFLEEWSNNVDLIFTDANKNKLRALYGNGYVEALEDILTRMKTGRNRRSSAGKIEKAFLDWTNDSVGTIMFFNTRSALLQTLSAVNFINFSDNNPVMAGLALANFPQYVKDFTTLFNSDFLKQRRSGLQIDVNADEIANSAKTSKNKVRAILSAILKFGFTPTQIADSFAIASGGASFYRNRINKYKKGGMTEQQAEQQAFLDFQEIAEETQQSARPDRISMQQAGGLGRLILAFGNTPMQYARLSKKASLDLINGRGDWKTNISKIMYYSVIQNIIFSSLQSALFTLLFDDTTEDDEKKRYFRLINQSADSILRGVGVYGAVASTVKNVILEIIEQSKSKRPDYADAAIEATQLSPPINSKLRKLISAGNTFTFKQSKEKVFTEGFSLDNPAFLAGGKILSVGLNLPADRVILKLDHLYTAMKPETELWQSIALTLGYSEWDLNMIEKQTKRDFQKEINRIERILKKL